MKQKSWENRKGSMSEEINKYEWTEEEWIGRKVWMNEQKWNELEDKYEWMNRRGMNWKTSKKEWIDEEWIGRQVRKNE